MALSYPLRLSSCSVSSPLGQPLPALPHPSPSLRVEPPLGSSRIPEACSITPARDESKCGLQRVRLGGVGPQSEDLPADPSAPPQQGLTPRSPYQPQSYLPQVTVEDTEGSWGVRRQPSARPRFMSSSRGLGMETQRSCVSCPGPHSRKKVEPSFMTPD